MGQMLRSWKEIARHMGASVRTVQRWESELHLPVRRIEAKRGAVVFAFPAELDSWLKDRGATRPPLVEDSYFRTVFMDSQFPSLVVDGASHILAANLAARDLAGVDGEQLLGERLERILDLEAGCAEGTWVDFLQCQACFGQANLRRPGAGILGVEFVTKRFPPGLHVVSVLSVREPWPEKEIWCRPAGPEFSFQVRPGNSPGAKRG